MRNSECGMRNAECKGEVMSPVDLKDRTRAFALAIVCLVEELPRSRTADVIGTQLLRAGTSVGANYRAACRARSRKEFIAKMGIVEEEADESQFWLELLDRKSTRLNSSHGYISYAVFCLQKKKKERQIS